MVKLGNVRGIKPFTVATLRATGTSLKRDIRDVKALPANPIAEADLSTAERIPLDFTATAEHAPVPSICGTLGYTFWAINKVPWQGDTPDPGAPLSELKLGKSYVLQVEEPHAACAPDPPARHELPHPQFQQADRSCRRRPTPSCFCRTNRPNSVSSPTIPATGCSIATSSSTRRPECPDISASFELFSL